MQSFTETFKNNNVLSILFLVVVVYALFVVYQYLSDKGVVGYEGNTQRRQPSPSHDTPTGGGAITEPFGEVNNGGAVTSSNESVEHLLPQDSNKQWNDLNPIGSSPLNGVNLLDAGHHIGTISQVKRNMNLQFRPEPSIPIVNTGPWNNSTIEEVDHTNQIGYRALL